VKFGAWVIYIFTSNSIGKDLFAHRLIVYVFCPLFLMLRFWICFSPFQIVRNSLAINLYLPNLFHLYSCRVGTVDSLDLIFFFEQDSLDLKNQPVYVHEQCFVRWIFMPLITPSPRYLFDVSVLWQ
jgi:hypothetical protein